MPIQPFKSAVAGVCLCLLLFGQPISAAGIGSSGLLPQGMETPSIVVDKAKSKLGAADESGKAEKLGGKRLDVREQQKNDQAQLKKSQALIRTAVKAMLLSGLWFLWVLSLQYGSTQFTPQTLIGAVPVSLAAGAWNDAAKAVIDLAKLYWFPLDL
ncbi:hypothetical protein CHLRE_16g681350v5 [Chlamydomonas reinhardtii]|uniref:Uncharacterized protein n=1 Tax=Chlamydomonas reinhardtii TaxID=3055 RepID=A8IS01_CHLRE|nr:uncharacterized protein CHLRE_16g681350v5 [Chlamydomonas reinhardtii]PNW72130.1 hypothetical protein CHLRE_16g681350v5 [Chlamydomonas reinhardtii]|eukprot:XP_001691889.1 predicted protein [Chlamydomonas reinhardtii]